MQRLTVKLLGSLMLLGVLLSLTGCGGTVWSRRDDVRIGQEVARDVEKAYRLDPNAENQRRVKEIGQKLVAVAGAKDFKYSFKVLDVDEVNAFALPGGPIYVFRGLLEMVGDDDDMLAFVLAHEMAHINQRHAAKQYSKGVWADILVTATTRGRVRDVAQLTNLLVQLEYSRRDEYEADRLGIEYAYKAGFDPNAGIRFFEILRKKERGGDKGVLANLRTHPLTENRIWRARQHIEKVTGQPAQEVRE